MILKGAPMIPAPLPAPNTAPITPDLASFRSGAQGVDPFSTPDPIMAAMGSYFAKKEAARQAELAELKARARRLLEGKSDLA